MTHLQYSQLQVEIAKVIKKKFSNLNVEETVKLTHDIIDVTIKTLNLEQE